MNEEKAKIEEKRKRWIAAINAGSASDFVGVLTEDVVWLPSHHDALNGKEQIKAWLKKPFSELNYDYSVYDIRFRIKGNWAVEQAKFSTRARTNSGEEMPHHEGVYTLIWRKSAQNVWLIERYIDQSADFDQ